MKPEPFDVDPNEAVEQASAWCLRLSERRLTRDDLDRLNVWLEAHEAHRHAFDDAVRVWNAVEQVGTAPEVLEMRSAALATFRRAQRARWAPRWVMPHPLIAAVVAAVVVLSVGVGLWLRELPVSRQTAVGERRVVRLADGSKVSLDGASKVQIHYQSRRRELRLEYGRAKFSVAPDPSRPFTVAVADKLVLATGTEFSVELVRDQVRVILYEGRVAVLSQARRSETLQHISVMGGAAADQTLTPGRELVVSVDRQAGQVLPVDPVRSLSWERGQLVFVDEPLSSAVEQVNRDSNEKLAIGDAAAARILISGTFTAGDTTSFIEGVTGVFPVRVRDEGNQKTFVSKDR